MLVLERIGALPVSAGDEAILVIPLGVQVVGVDAEEASGVVAGFGYGLASFGGHQGFDTLRVSVMAFPILVRGQGVVDVVPVRPGVIIQVALVGTMIDPTLLRALGDIVLMGKWSVHTLPRMPYWQEWLTTTSWMILMLRAWAASIRSRSWLGGVQRFQPRVDPRPVVAVVVEAGAILDRGVVQIALKPRSRI